MEAVFAKLVSISILANWLILAVILLRALLKKAPRRISCILWAVVAVRLVVPVSIESPVSLIPETTAVIQEAVDTSLIHPEAVPSDTAPSPTQEEGGNPIVSGSSPVSVIPLVWACGVFLMLCHLMLSYLRMRRLVGEAVPDKENIWICDAVTTPFILGLLRPKIYLPSGLSEANREYVIAHERSHLRCGDHWWKPAAFLLLAVFWFDPLMWIAYLLVCRDIEFACDERVVRRYGLREKKAYSEALLECSSSRKQVLACPVAFGETAVVQRVRNVLNYRKPRFWILLVSVIIIAVTAVGFLTVPVKKEAPDAPDAVQDEAGGTMPPKDPVSTVPVQDSGNAAMAPAEENLLSQGEWGNFPDGIRIESYTGQTFTAHVMIIRDPSAVYLAASSDPLSMDTPGTRMDETMERENALAAVNAGPFFDDGTTSQAVGSIPFGLVLSEDEVIWNALYDQIPEKGFVGFNKDNVLIVAASMSEAEATEQQIRDGCSSGPVLMINGKPNLDVYNGNSGYHPRTAVGQRADGAVVFVCADGRTPDSLGATYADMIDLLTEYGAVNACALNGGSSSAMLYRDADGRYGEKGAVQRINRYSLAQSSIRRMPTFWMVKPA